MRRLTGVGVAVGLAVVGLSVPAIALPSPFPRTDDYRPSKRDYDRCTERLLTLNVSVEEATSACARSLKPSDLSKCVVDVVDAGGVEAIAALGACRQVRRPVEMSSCVEDIRGKISEAVPGDVLENCRRSVLPERYANCVIGTTRAANYQPGQALSTCIDGVYLPRELDPTFIPYPLPVVDNTPAVEPAPIFTPAPAIPTGPTTPTPPTQVTPQRY